jgi:hypothetical protein
MILTKEQVDLLDLAKCEKTLKKLLKSYDFETSFSKLPKEVWDKVDDIANTLLYLEDRIEYINLKDRLDEARPTLEKRALAKMSQS